MKPAEQWRWGLARFVTQFYARRPGLRMALLGGSMADGTADAYADMDMFLYWEGLDTVWLTDQMPLREVAGPRLSGQAVWNGRAFREQYVIGHLRLDIEHLDLATWQAATEATLEGLAPDPATQVRLAGWQTAQVLHGETEFLARRARLTTYPPGLAAPSAEYHLARSADLWALAEQSLARGDWPGFNWAMAHLAQHSLGVLAALNRRFLPTEGLQRLQQHVAQLPLSPPDSAERLPALFSLAPPEAAIALEAYLLELIALVESHLPAVDVRLARQALHIEEDDTPPPND